MAPIDALGKIKERRSLDIWAQLDRLKARRSVGTAIQSGVVLATAGVSGISSRRKTKHRCSK